MEHPKRAFQDWANFSIGLAVAVYPWILGYSNQVIATRVSLISGILIMLVAGAALIRFAEWEEWLNMLLGVGVACTPFIFKLTNIDMATQVLFIGGVLVAALSLWEIWMVHHPEPQETLPH